LPSGGSFNVNEVQITDIGAGVASENGVACRAENGGAVVGRQGLTGIQPSCSRAFHAGSIHETAGKLGWAVAAVRIQGAKTDSAAASRFQRKTQREFL
jgi:hypothetical protein